MPSSLSYYLCNPFSCFFSTKTDTVYPAITKKMAKAPDVAQSISPAPTTMIRSFSSEYNMDEIKNLFEKRVLKTAKPEIHTKYIHVTFEVTQLLYHLGTKNQSELNEALSSFNTAFAETALFNTRIDEQTRAMGVDDDLIDALIMRISKNNSNLSAVKSHVMNNILSAIIFVSNKMNQNWLECYLPYHNPRHAIEMFLDVIHELSKEFDVDLPIHLLLPLCALAHDVCYRHQRVDDELQSAELLKGFLSPILAKLMPHHRDIITQLIYIFIPGASTPCALNSSQSGEAHTSLESICAVVDTFLAARQDAIREQGSYKWIQHYSRMIEVLDTKRTWVRRLHQNDGPYDNNKLVAPFPYKNASWSIIEEALSISLTLPLKKRMTQSLRVMFEMSLLGNKEHRLGLYVFRHQNHLDNKALLLTEEDIRVLADKIDGPKNDFSEMNFSKRMRNTYSWEQENGFDDIELKYQEVLSKLYACFIKSTTLDDNRFDVAQALIHVASEQDGCYVTIEQILKQCEKAEMSLTPSIEYSGRCTFEISTML